MNKLAHQVTEDGVLIVLRHAIGTPQSMRATVAEAARFARDLLADVDPEAASIATGQDITVGPLTIQRGQRVLRVDGRPIHLSNHEFGMIEALAMRRGGIVTKEAMLDHLYGGRDEPALKIVDVYICKLRNKLRPFGCNAMIETVWGRGYRLVTKPAAAA